MNLETASTFQSRLLFRISHEPTASARTLRSVIRLHSPHTRHTGDVVCVDCLDTPYPCATQQTVALELGVPLPTEPAYGELIDG